MRTFSYFSTKTYVVGTVLRPPDKSAYWKIIFFFSAKTYVVRIQKNSLMLKLVGKEINAILGDQTILIWTYAVLKRTSLRQFF